MGSALTRHIFYGDLNCPFCFAQNERLVKLGLQHLVTFRGTEHLPELPADTADDVAEELLLREELTRLREKAPELVVRDPAFRPNTRLAMSAIAAATDVHPEAAPLLRTSLYRALWQEGRDISTEEVVMPLIREAGLTGLDLAAGAKTLSEWTRQWDEGAFDRRLPAMVARDGAVLLGLADEDTLRQFVWIQRADASDVSATCSAKGPADP